MRNLVTVSNAVKEVEYDKILLSDVVITRKRNVFWGRKWRSPDIQMGVGILAFHLLALFAPFVFCWDAFLFAFFRWVLCWMFGVYLSYHRNLAHHSFKLPKWLEYMFAYLGVLSFQRDPIFWVSIHRFHHQYVDSEKDAHSPTFGFWYSHIGWLFDSGYIIEKYQERNNVQDLKNQVFYRFLKKTYFLHVFTFTALVYAYGGFIYLVWVVVPLPYVIMSIYVGRWYDMGLPYDIYSELSWSYRNQAWDTGDLSKNNWWVALVTFGDGWHNNHHAFEYSARHGLEWWQIDFCWYMIRFLEALGLATNVKLPTEGHKLKKSFTSHNKVM